MRLALGVLVLGAACSTHHPMTSDGKTTSDGSTTSDARIDASIDAGNPTGIGGPPVGQCSDDWCWVLPLPQGVPLSGIWAGGPNDVWTVTGTGIPGLSVMLHYDGSAWTQYGAMGQFTQGTFWGTSSNDVWLVASVLWHWDGTTWAQSTEGGNSLAVTVIGGTGASNVWALDANANAHQWDGSQWIDHPGPGFTALALGGTGSTVIAVSNTGTLVQWLGTAWGTFDASSHPGIAAVVIDSTHVVVAQDGAVAFWDNGTWTTRTTPDAQNWQVIAATSPTNVWVGMRDHRCHWDGAWTCGVDPGGSVPAQMSATATDVFVAQLDAQVRRWNGSAWSALTVRSNNIDAVWGTSPADIWVIAGSRPLHWDGNAWTDVAFPFGTDYYLHTLWGSAPDNYWIAAGHRVSFSVAERVLFHWDGMTWALEGTYGTEDNVAVQGGFKRMWGTGPDDVYAVSNHAAYHRDANGWAQLSALSFSSSTVDVFGSGASDVYVLADATLWRWNGSTWTSKTAPANLSAGWADSPSDVWLRTSAGGMLHYDGTFFVSMDPPDGGVPTGGGVHITPLPATFPVSEGWVAPDGHSWVAGRGLLAH